MEPDFSGYATKAGLKCTDGRTIMPDAFKHQDTMQVPLVWQHGHTDPTNVLGHATLENREDGVYCYAFFNGSSKAEHAKEAVRHGDIRQMSIWANDLIERSGRVLHGAIREVSLVLAGANPGALIENVTIRHSDMGETVLDDEAIIYTGIMFDNLEISHADSMSNDPDEDGDDDSMNEQTIQDVYDGMTNEQQTVVHYLIEKALSVDDAVEDSVSHDGMMDDSDSMDESTVGAIYDSMTDDQKLVTHFLVGQALSADYVADRIQEENVSHSVNFYDTTDEMKGNTEMKHNVFESNEGAGSSGHVLSHDDMKGIIADATKSGSLKDAVESYALAHNIDNIGTLFPEVVATSQSPNFLQRRVEWVQTLLGAVNKSPFSRIKTLNADITIDDARAKGYVKGAMKKEEFFGITRRVTTPTTIYKKQAMDRDDIVDITDFDVVVWLKNEMRLMLDEELARAILIGDGRDVADADKVNEQCIRPIASEHELYATTVTVNLKDTNTTTPYVSNADELIDAILANRWQYKGTGTPTLFTSETVIASFLTAKDSLGRRIYQSIDEVATVLRVAAIVPVEAMEAYAYPSGLIAILVNPVDYTVGATAGGEVNMFDFFDIDYNKQKYLIETRACGALTRLKSAIIIRNVANSSDVAVTPNAPTFVQSTGVVTINATANVTYKNADTGAVLTTGAQPAIPAYSQINIQAVPSTGYYLPSDATGYWTFQRNA